MAHQVLEKLRRRFESEGNTKLWFNAEGKVEKHLLQTALDTLSYAENIPLRVLDWEALKAFPVTDLLEEGNQGGANSLITEYCDYWKTRFECLSEKDREAKDKACNDKVVPPICFTKPTTPAWISEQEQRVWLSLPSNPLPVHTLFRSCKEWCWFVLIWFLAHRDKIEEISEQQGKINAFGIPQWELHFRWLNLGQGDKKHLLVIGPLYKPTGKSEARAFSEGKGQEILACFEDFYQHACASKSLTTVISQQRMQRMLLARIALPKQETQARIKKSVEALTAMTKGLELDKAGYRSAECFAVMRAYIAVCRWRRELWNAKKKSCELVLYFSLPDSDKKEHFLRIVVDLKEEKLTILQGRITCSPDLTSQTQSFNRKRFLCALSVMESGQEKACQQEDLDRLNLHVARWEERMASRRRYFQQLSAEMLQNWLQDHAGELHLSNNRPAGKGHKEGVLCEHICFTILDDLRGDICHLYRLEQKSGQVKLLGAAYSRLYQKDDQETLRQQIEEATKDERKQSAVFRCIDNATTGYYETQKNSKTGALNFLLYNKKGKVTQSGIFCPIIFQGRIWGILEVTGVIPYQFSWTHQYALSNIVSILNTHFYEQYLRFSLKDLTRLALEDKEKSPDQLSDLLSSIFLCQGATIWLKHRDEQENYMLYGTNIDGLTEGDTDLHKETMTIRQSSERDKKSLILKLKKQYIEQGDVNYLVGELNEKTAEAKELVASRPHRMKLYQDLGLEEVMVFALTKEVIYQTPEGREASLLGFVTLHHNKQWGYEKNWQTVVDLVSGQLVVALEMVDALQDKEDDMMALLHHEIKQDAYTLGKVPGSLKASVRNLVTLKNESERHIRTIKWGMTRGELVETEDHYDTLIDLLSRNQIFLPDVSAIEKQLISMEQRATLLEEKIRLLSFSKVEGVTLGDLFGENCFDINDPIEEVDLYRLCHDIAFAKKKKNNYIDIQGLKGYRIRHIRIEILNNLMQNMLDNAIKYGIEGKPITMELEREQDRASYRLSVESFGQPLAEGEDKNKLFSKGFRSASYQKEPEKYQGEGMGLFVVKSICEYLGIKYEVDIKVTNVASAEYVFTFWLPRIYVIAKPKSV